MQFTLLKLSWQRPAIEFRFITRLQAVVSYGLIVSAAILLLLAIIGCTRYEEPIAWMFAGTCFACACILSSVTASFSFWMTTNVTYRLLQILSLSVSLASLPGILYLVVLLAQVILETQHKLFTGFWADWEIVDERGRQSIRTVMAITYSCQVALLTAQAMLACCILARYPYLCSTPTWKRNSMTSSWHINNNNNNGSSRTPLDCQSQLLK